MAQSFHSLSTARLLEGLTAYTPAEESYREVTDRIWRELMARPHEDEEKISKWEPIASLIQFLEFEGADGMKGQLARFLFLHPKGLAYATGALSRPTDTFALSISTQLLFFRWETLSTDQKESVRKHIWQAYEDDRKERTEDSVSSRAIGVVSRKELGLESRIREALMQAKEKSLPYHKTDIAALLACHPTEADCIVFLRGLAETKNPKAAETALRAILRIDPKDLKDPAALSEYEKGIVEALESIDGMNENGSLTRLLAQVSVGSAMPNAGKLLEARLAAHSRETIEELFKKLSETPKAEETAAVAFLDRVNRERLKDAEWFGIIERIGTIAERGLKRNFGFEPSEKERKGRSLSHQIVSAHKRYVRFRKK